MTAIKIICCKCLRVPIKDSNNKEIRAIHPNRLKSITSKLNPKLIVKKA